MAGKKRRIDALLVVRRLAPNEEQARRLIGSGQVFVADQICDKAGHLVPEDCLIRVKAQKRFVSRGGEKLEACFVPMQVDPLGLVCADIGCSTGGFTDCLLQHGAARVYSVDVGYGLLDWKLRKDPRVIVLERTNARFLTEEHIPESIDLAVIDASFISLELLLAPLLPFFKTFVRIVALVKPQFQLARELVGPGGIVSDQALHQDAIDMVRRFGADLGLVCAAVAPSPIQGMKGNKEFLMLLTGNRVEEKEMIERRKRSC